MIPGEQELRDWRIEEVRQCGDDYRKRWIANKAYEMRLSPTRAEWAMRLILEESVYIWYPQAVVGRYIVDFLCPALNIYVEVDGRIHDRPDVRERDERRNKDLARHGLIGVRAPNSFVIGDPWHAAHELDEIIRQVLAERRAA
jgi:very-short-patch-repair endonuclease